MRTDLKCLVEESVVMIKPHDRKYFYKYVSAKAAKRILDKCEIKWSSPLLFNDPFDCQIVFQDDIGDGKEYIEKTVDAIFDKPHRSFIDWMLGDSRLVSESTAEGQRGHIKIMEILTNIATERRIFCVSEEKNDLLMWSHYAREHKGAVIKFRCIPEKDTGLCVAEPVKYSKHIPVLPLEDYIDLIHGPLEDRWRIADKILGMKLLTKGVAWEYEKEWRVIVEQQGEEDYEFRGIFEEELEAIYLGCRMSCDDKKKLLATIKAKRKHMRVFEAERDQKDFKLNFKEISY